DSKNFILSATLCWIPAKRREINPGSTGRGLAWENLNRADSILSRASPQDLDLLDLPELAFIVCNFRSLCHISPYLKNTTSGIISLCARTTALEYNCVLAASYLEKVNLSPKWPASPIYYNSATVVNPNSETVANYRKFLLFTTDEMWDGHIDGFGDVVIGISHIIFKAAWNAWEFARYVLHHQVNLIILSMACMTCDCARSFSRTPKEPYMKTLSYWLTRLEPVTRKEGEDEMIAVFANGAGTEENAVHAGTSAVRGVQAGEVKVYRILGRGDRELLVVNTSARPKLTKGTNSPSTYRGPWYSSRRPLGCHLSRRYYKRTDSEHRIINVIRIYQRFESQLRQPAFGFHGQNVTPFSASDNSNRDLHRGSHPENARAGPTFILITPFPQAYFLLKDIAEPTLPEPRPAQGREPTPTQPDSTKSVERYSTPVPFFSIHARPASLKSWNCSRSRGPSLQNSSPTNGIICRIGNIISDEQGLQQDCPVLEAMSMNGLGMDVKSFVGEALDANEIIYIEGEDRDSFESLAGNVLCDARFRRAEFIAKHINNQQPSLPPRVASKNQCDGRESSNRSRVALRPSKIPPEANKTSPNETVLVDRSCSRKDSRDRAPLKPWVLPKS
ncbi:carbon-nitrogen hydrolase, partial [Diplocarpon rosae]